MFNKVPVNCPVIPSFLSFSQVLSSKLDLALPILSQARCLFQTFLPQSNHLQTLFSVEFMLNHSNLRVPQTQESYSASLA